MTVVLGPCHCHDCGRLLTWDGVWWTDDTGRHRCHGQWTCRLSGCWQRVQAKGLCMKHYQKARRLAA